MLVVAQVHTRKFEYFIIHAQAVVGANFNLVSFIHHCIAELKFNKMYTLRCRDIANLHKVVDFLNIWKLLITYLEKIDLNSIIENIGHNKIASLNFIKRCLDNIDARSKFKEKDQPLLPDPLDFRKQTTFRYLFIINIEIYLRNYRLLKLLVFIQQYTLRLRI